MCVHRVHESQETALLARVTPFPQPLHGFDTFLAFFVDVADVAVAAAAAVVAVVVDEFDGPG